LSTILTKRISCIDTIVQILEKIEDTQTNKEMLDAFKIGTHTLNQTTKKFGLTVEAVDETFSELSDVLADQQEIDRAFLTGASQVLGPTEEDLEQELEKLMAVENVAEENVENLISEIKQLKVVNSPPQVTSSIPRQVQPELV